MEIAEATITMSMREVDRVKTVQAVVDRLVPVGLADDSQQQIFEAAQHVRPDGVALEAAEQSQHRQLVH